MANYFVKNGGNDAADGLSDANAWETIKQVSDEFDLSTFAAGDTISFKRGDTFPVAAVANRLNVDTVGGAIGNHIVIGAYDSGAKPIFQGTGVGGPGRAIFVDTVNYITVQDIDIEDMDDGSVFVVESAHHVIIQRIDIHDITATVFAAGFRIRDDSKIIWILDCTVDTLIGEGIYFGRDDTLDETKQCWVNNCLFENCAAEGIELKDTTTEIFVTNCTLRDNGTDENPADDWTQISLGGRFHVIYNCRIEGTAGSNRNGIYSGRYQGGVQTNSGKFNTIERCLFVNCTGNRGAIYAAGGVTGEGNQITNCTFVDCTDGIYCDAGAAGYVIRNCIFDGITGFAVNMQVAETRYDFDYNKYSDGDIGVWFESAASRNLAAYVQATLGQETNGDSNAASFAETGMYTLAGGSDAIDSGESTATVYDWNDEYAPSGAVDQGWREFDYDDVKERLGGLPHRTFISIHDESAVFGRYSGTSGIGLSVDGNVPTPQQGQRSINVNVTSTADRYAERTSLGSLKHFFVSLQIYVDDLTMASGDVFDVFQGLTAGATPIMRIQINYNGANTRVRASLWTDAGAWTDTSYFNLVAGWNHVEVFWSAAPDTATNDGQIALWLNDIEEEHIDTANNHDNTVDRFRVGTPSGLDAGTSGTLYIDIVRLDWLRYMASAISTTTYLYTTPVVTVTV